MKKASNTDWNKLAKMKDHEIDTSDIAELDADFFKRAEIRVPPKKSVTMRSTPPLFGAVKNSNIDNIQLLRTIYV